MVNFCILILGFDGIASSARAGTHMRCGEIEFRHTNIFQDAKFNFFSTGIKKIEN